MVTDMMGRLDRLGDTSESSFSEDEINILLLVDSQRKGPINKINIPGKKHSLEVQEADSFEILLNMTKETDFRKKLYSYDMILVASGMRDLVQGDDGFKAYNKVCKIIKSVDELQVDIALLQIPPITGRPATDSRIFNMKIESLPEKHDNVQIIKVKDLYNKATDVIYTKDGELTQDTLETLSSAVNSITIPDKKVKKDIKPETKTPVAAVAAADSLDLASLQIEVLPVPDELLGLVIGRNGSNIRKIEQETQTRLKITEGSNVVIIGSHRDIVNARDKITTHLKNKAKREPEYGTSPVPKRPAK